MKNDFTKNKLLRHGLLVGLLILLLTTGIYAWIYGDVAPTVTGDMKIGDNSGLIFEISSGDSTEDAQLIDLNKYLGPSIGQMVLNEVSTIDGVNFIKRNTADFYQESGNPGGDGEILTFTEAVKNTLTNNVEKGGTVFTGDYVKTELNLRLDYAEPGSKYYIYFLQGTLNATSGYVSGFSKGTGSTITDDGLKALRACITVEDATEYGPSLSGTTHSAIFGNAKENVADGLTKAIISTVPVELRIGNSQKTDECDIAGDYYIDYLYEDENPAQSHTYGSMTQGMDVYSFSECAIDAQNGLAGESIPNPNYLFVLDHSCKKVKITITLWLEGGSMYCTNSNISVDDNVSYNMYMVAYRVDEESGSAS